MRLQIALLTLITSALCFASPEKEVTDLFAKYDLIVKEHKFDLVDEVFTQKFLKDVGGKEEFIQNIKEFPKENEKSRALPDKIKWKKGTKDEIFFAKKVQSSNLKSKTGVEPSGPSFVIVKENGKLKIDGTISDDH